MKRRKKTVIGCIILVVLIGIIAVFYFSQKKWYETQGWQGEHNSDSVWLKGIEGLEFECSVDTRIVYAYVFKSGEVEIKITKDPKGEDVIKKIYIDETCNGSITFENENPETCYIFETASDKDTEYECHCEIEVRRSNWEQMLILKQRGI